MYRESDGMSRDSTWEKRAERGSGLWMKFAIWGARRLSSESLRFLLPLIAFYYFLFDSSARKSSKDFLNRVALSKSERPPRAFDIFRHLHCFAQIILDRFALWANRTERFNVTYQGLGCMEKLLDQGKGAMLVGAHLGSFDMLRLVAREANVPVNVIMYIDNAQRINDAFSALDPESMIRVINLDPTSSQTGFEVRRCIERGEFVAILADRVGETSQKRVSRINFLGSEASFSQGPFHLSALMGLPIIFTVGLRRGRGRYEVFMEELSDGERVPRSERDALVLSQMKRFVSRLEYYCLDSPFQWFNFYDFWSGDSHAHK